MNVLKRFEKTFLFVGVLFSLALFLSACNKDSKLGSDLLDDDLLQVEFTDTFSIIASTIAGEDSILTYDDFTITTELFTGSIDDPFFGTQTFDAFFLPGLGATIPSFYDADNDAFATVDSVVLIVNVDTSLYYGDTSAVHNVDVFLLEEEPDFDGTYYSNQDFATQMMPVAENQQFVLNREAYSFIFDGDTTSTAPSIRLKLDNSIGELLVMDTAAVKSDTLIRDVIPGFKIVNRPDRSGVIPMDLETKTLIDRGNKLFVFYTDTVSKFYAFPLGGVRHIFNENDKSGTDVELALTTPSIGDSLLYIQGYGGADIKVEFPSASFSALGKVVVKKAELEMTVAPQQGDEDFFESMSLIFIDSEDPDTGERERVVDLLNASAAGAIQAGFGGSLREERDENDELIRTFYNFNLTAYFQSLLEDGSDETGVLYLKAASPELIIGRSVLYGPNHSTYPMKLKLTYSIPN